ncbi:hypothetical protein CC80DRAFT_318361 [Byssothecium circinans]|uniref:Uncharacterized protein n=1 Tax=Byssothecium circinans TaxID=147558 RepID=A0A6A5TH18_9PLEO|nr:hypothetical protein CC80DRAFT_329507 [Byssothecium circinans]KAF1948296.1 hypothetical protein CC80DRAFT_318361 [Byssothecium circinans]
MAARQDVENPCNPAFVEYGSFGALSIASPTLLILPSLNLLCYTTKESSFEQLDPVIPGHDFFQNASIAAAFINQEHQYRPYFPR